MNSPSQRERQPSARDWIAIFGAILGAFMAVLDIQITNAALKDIQGGIAASLDEGTWISTGYLVAEIVTIPLSVWLAGIFSMKRYLIANCALFLLFSMLCGLSDSLTMMVICRVGQGFTGGVFIPLAMTIVLRCLPPSKQPIGLTLFGVTATFAPAIGPTIGGYLTDYYGWPWVFYVNLAPGVVMLAALWFTLRKSAPQLGLLRQGDWLGIATMAVGLSALQAVLEEGNKDDWFGSPFIVRLAVIAAVSLSLFVWIELSVEKPLLKLRLLAQRNFGIGTIAAVFLGFALFGSVYLLPAYLGQVQRYNAEQIGAVLAWTGLPQLLLIPLVPKLMQRFDARYIAATGLLLFAYSSFMNIAMSLDYAGDQLFIPNIVRAVGQALTLAPLSALSLGSVAPQDAAAASGISNMMRNLGGAIGTAVLATIVTKREQFHSNIIGQSVDLGREEVRTRIAQMTDYFTAHGVSDPAAAHQQAIIALGNAVKRQALVLGFSDTFAVIGIVLVLAAIAIISLRKASGGAAGGAH